MNSDKCIMPYCRNPVHLNLRGMPLCEKHWSEMCEKDHELHKKKVDKVQLGSADSEETRQALVKIVEELKKQ